jgi:2-keto-3-deoxy-L-rhamnonate aldolase RhmA
LEGPGVDEQILGVLAKAAARGIGAGVMGGSVEDCVRRRDQGFRMVALGSEAALLIRSVNDALLALRGRTEKHLWF